MGGFLCGKNSMWDDFRVGGFPCGMNFVREISLKKYEELVTGKRIIMLSCSDTFLHEIFPDHCLRATTSETNYQQVLQVVEN